MSALGHKQTKRHHGAMSALPPKADIASSSLSGSQSVLPSNRSRPAASVCLGEVLEDVDPQRCAYIAAGMAWLDVSHLRIEWRQRPARSVSSTTPRAHASSMQPVLDNRHVA